jgi:hypothetical protein
MSPIRSAAWAFLALVVAGCGNRAEQAKQQATKLCRDQAAAEYPDGTPSRERFARGETVTAEGLQNVARFMEGCMNSHGFSYDETIAGCQLPPDANSEYVTHLKGRTECYSARK